VEVSVNANLKGLLKPTPGSQVLGTACVPFYHAMDPAPARRLRGMLRKSSLYKTKSYVFIYGNVIYLVWCTKQNKRIAPLSFLNGCRKRRLKDK
jgi:hypothetical protein